MLNLLLPLISAIPSLMSLFENGVDKDGSNLNGVIGVAKKVLGVDSDEDLELRLNNLKQFELDKLKLTYEREYNLYKVEVDDRISARNREALMKDSFGNKLMYFLASIVVLVNLVLLVLAFNLPDTLNNPGVMALVGSHTAALTLVLSYFFGSSINRNK